MTNSTKQKSVPPAAPQPATLAPHSAGPAAGSVVGGVVALDGAPATQCPKLGGGRKYEWYWRARDGEADCGIFYEERPGHAYSVCRAPRYAKREDWEEFASRVCDLLNGISHQRQATRDREVTMNDDTGETKDSVVAEADSNAVPSTLSVPRSLPK